MTKYTESFLDSFLKEYGQYADDIITANVIDMGGYVPEVRKYLQNRNGTDFATGMTVPCYTLWNTFIVTCEGYVTACCADFQNYFAYADLNKESIRSAWTNSYITKLREDHLAGRIGGTPCQTCVGGPIVDWKPVREDLYSPLRKEEMFDMAAAAARIKKFEEEAKTLTEEKVNDFKSKLFFGRPVRDYAGETAEKLMGKDDIVLFGAGITGTKVKKYLDSYGIRVRYFIDNNPNKQGKDIDGVEILPEKKLLELCPDAVILISCDAFMEITRQLVGDGFKRKNILYFEPDWLNSPRGQGGYISAHLKDFAEVFYELADEKSREVYLALLNYKITHELSFLEGKADSVPYFDKELIGTPPSGVWYSWTAGHSSAIPSRILWNSPEGSISRSSASSRIPRTSRSWKNMSRRIRYGTLRCSRRGFPTRSRYSTSADLPREGGFHRKGSA